LISLDSPWAAKMLEAVQTPVWTFGVHPKADLRAENIFLSPKATHFDLAFKGRSVSAEIPLLGSFNVLNALGAVGIALEKGASLEAAAAALADFEGVPGRLEKVPNHLGISVLVDFAHTGESLEQALRTAREIGKGKVICVFGCGGGRDPDRRQGMGRAASALADLSIVTSDNPRNEEPKAIADQILQAYSDGSKALVELDRKKAIHQAVALAAEGDVVLIAGKGHEKTQIFAHQTIAFDDVEVAKEALQKFKSSDRLSNS
jgi:UDP-N-acetylmuramoyl-L-alanyl-D-glutamate--2,6-diaminopimelate ligase